MLLPLQAPGNRHHSKDGLKEFAEMAFFARARNTGNMSEVVDKLKANLRQAGLLRVIAIGCQTASCALSMPL